MIVGRPIKFIINAAAGRLHKQGETYGVWKELPAGLGVNATAVANCRELQNLQAPARGSDFRERDRGTFPIT